MSILIDDLRILEFNCYTRINGMLYISKPYINENLFCRLKDALKIIAKKAIAVHYKEDELK